MAKSRSGILDIIFPPRCAFCRGLLKRGESGMCAECAKSLPYTSPSERAGTDFVAACVAPLRYEGAVREALHRYKFQGVTAYAGVFGRLVADCIREGLVGEYELISWVPLSSQRLKERGYDQAMLIAMAAALELGPFSFDFERLRFMRNGTEVELSKTEQRLLRLLVEHRGQTLTREQLLDRVWDGGEFVDANALSVAVKRLRDKLTDAPIKTVYGLGYTWEEKR